MKCGMGEATEMVTGVSHIVASIDIVPISVTVVVDICYRKSAASSVIWALEYKSGAQSLHDY